MKHNHKIQLIKWITAIIPALYSVTSTYAQTPNEHPLLIKCDSLINDGTADLDVYCQAARYCFKSGKKLAKDNVLNNAEDMFLRAIHYAKLYADVNLILDSYLELTDIYSKQMQCNKGIAAISDCEEYMQDKTITNLQNKAALLIAKADFYRLQQNYPMAIDTYKRSLEYCQSIHYYSGIVGCTVKIVVLLDKTANSHREAEYYFAISQKAMENAEKEGMSVYPLKIKNYISITNYKFLRKEYDEAIAAWDSVISTFDQFLNSIAKKNPDFDRDSFINLKAYDYEYRIMLLYGKGDSTQVDNIVSNIDNIINGEKSIRTVDLYKRVATYYKSKNQYEKAITYFNILNDIYKTDSSNQGNYGIFQTNSNIIKCLIALHRTQEARQLLESTLAMIPTTLTTENCHEVIDLYQARALLSSLENDTEQTLNNISYSIKLISNMILDNFGYMSAETFADLWQTTNIVCARILQITQSINNPNQEFLQTVYNTTLMQKNMNFVSQNYLKNASQKTQATTQTYEHIAELKHLLFQQHDIDNNKKDSIFKLADSLEHSLLKQIGDFSSIKHLLSPDYNKIKSSLREGEIAVEFSQIDEYDKEILYAYPENCKYDYYAIAFGHNSNSPHLIPLFSHEELISYKLSNGKTLAESREQNTPDDIATIYSDTTLTNFIWGKITKLFPEAKTIYFSPTGSLITLALEYLATDSTSCMADKYNMVRISSTAAIKYDTVSMNTYKDYLLIGGVNYDTPIETLNKIANQNGKGKYCLRANIAPQLSPYKYLEGTFEECDYIAHRISNTNQLTFLSDTQATEETFKKISGTSPNIIHIATHGYLNADTSNNGTQEMLNKSALLLSGANNYIKGNDPGIDTDDGFLTPLEISELDLSNTNLAVLSACGTGLGHINSNGIFGLERGFKLAGVNTIMMSLWNIADESTALFMRKFYAALISGATPREALATAQKYFRSGLRFQHPYYWAQFVIID